MRSDKNRYVVVFVITTVIFVLGLLLGNYFSNTKLSKIDEMQQDLKTHTLAIELQYMIFEDDPCDEINFTPLTDELYELGQRLDFMENSLGNDNKNVLELKAYYSLLEIRQWLFLKADNKKCNMTRPLVLFFYSNEGDCPKCEEQGFILSYLRKKYPEIRVYSFDINIENEALGAMKKKYAVDQVPTIIIDEEKFIGFFSTTELESMLFE